MRFYLNMYVYTSTHTPAKTKYKFNYYITFSRNYVYYTFYKLNYVRRICTYSKWCAVSLNLANYVLICNKMLPKHYKVRNLKSEGVLILVGMVVLKLLTINMIAYTGMRHSDAKYCSHILPQLR